MQKSSVLKEQYKNDDNLNIRIKLHKIYSVNKEGFRNWTYRNLPNFNNKTVLELGCGNGELWINKSDDIFKMESLILSDISQGMVDTTKENIGENSKIKYLVLNAEDTKIENSSVDYVIANHMLYHVPDLNKALKEIYRILKPSGKLFATTFGENGILKYVNKLIGDIDTPIKSTFTLQNGLNSLEKEFLNIKRIDYMDSLRISNEFDLLDYIYSMSGFVDNVKGLKENILTKLQKIKSKNNGIIEINKEAGMFIACK